MSAPANTLRGEAELVLGEVKLKLRPTFAALTAAEEELGSLFALVERAAGGRLKLAELASLFWHCLADVPPGLTRAQLADLIVDRGLAAVTPALKTLLEQILKGR